jgi:hydroxyethylthiazole kinase-like uncharacterized protein yjeF
LKIVTTEQMREMEQRAAEIGISPETLMENAGLAVAREVKEWLGDIKERHILLLIGPGNNGGDGLVAARHLHDWGAKVHLYFPTRRSGSDNNYRLTQQRGIHTIVAGQGEQANLDGLLSSVEAVIDALFGTGRLRPMKGGFQQVLSKVGDAKEERQAALQIIALDLPSGLDSDSGAIDDACLGADVTITLACPKQGLFAFPGATKVGKLIVADIGIPSRLAEGVRDEVITAGMARLLLPHRPINSNKGTFGKVLVCGGSINYIGAAYLACVAASRVGAGLVTLATARSLQTILASKLTEVVYAPLPESEPGIMAETAFETLQPWLADHHVLLLGCGSGQSPQTVEFIKSLLFSAALPDLVLDADALNTLAQVPQWWQKLTRDAVLTPHPGEMSRLTGLSIQEIQTNRSGIAREKAISWQKTIVLKGAYTVIAAPDGRIRVNPVANAGLASAGTGDVLAGAIAGLSAQGLSLFDAATCGVYLHSQAGEVVGRELGDAGIIASDLLPALPRAIKRLRERARIPEKSGNYEI